ncbi:TetR/AcrR family transcriptional regulator [Streptomyces sp. ITFR-6]|uniref:TetR/AcrR family transcriptional regulator n=1 Tax=Streptomyces sp. ITFR-6 TaxID=3075197 RepID=UPI0037D9A3B1
MASTPPPCPPSEGHPERPAEEPAEDPAPSRARRPGADPTTVEPCLRADAVRNRARLLEAAGRLVAERGAAGVTMEAVAAAASVGKGTVFRRFGDRAGLLLALLDRSAQQLRAGWLSGPPPLGPGAPGIERLRAFGVAVIRWSAEQLELILASQSDPARRLAHPIRQAFLAHVTALLEEVTPDADYELQAQALLAYLDPSLIHHLTEQRGMPLERVEAGWTELVDRVTRS